MNPVMKQTCAYINNMKSPARLIKEDILLLNQNIKNAQCISEKRQERPYSDLLKALNNKIVNPTTNTNINPTINPTINTNNTNNANNNNPSTNPNIQKPKPKPKLDPKK